MGFGVTITTETHFVETGNYINRDKVDLFKGSNYFFEFRIVL